MLIAPPRINSRKSTCSQRCTLIHHLQNDARAQIRHDTRQHDVSVADTMCRQIIELLQPHTRRLKRPYLLSRFYWMFMAAPWTRSTTPIMDYGTPFHIAASRRSPLRLPQRTPRLPPRVCRHLASWSQAHINDLAASGRQHKPNQAIADYPSALYPSRNQSQSDTV